MISIWPPMYAPNPSFVDEMIRLLSEALMWPVAIWLVWVVLQRRFRKQRAE